MLKETVEVIGQSLGRGVAVFGLLEIALSTIVCKSAGIAR
jgi:hypothetical protein